MQWVKHINKIKDGLLFISGGVLEYFDKKVVKKFLSDLADNFPESEIAFNTVRNNLIISIFNKRFMKRLGMESARAKWKFNFIEKIKRWDRRIVVLEEYPIFSKIIMERSWNRNIIRATNFYNKHKMINMVHLKFIK
jgi:O-methyltransferase involved in polyketide biosynthesis